MFYSLFILWLWYDHHGNQASNQRHTKYTLFQKEHTIFTSIKMQSWRGEVVLYLSATNILSTPVNFLKVPDAYLSYFQTTNCNKEIEWKINFFPD